MVMDKADVDAEEERDDGVTKASAADESSKHKRADENFMMIMR